MDYSFAGLSKSEGAKPEFNFAGLKPVADRSWTPERLSEDIQSTLFRAGAPERTTRPSIDMRSDALNEFSRLGPSTEPTPDASFGETMQPVFTGLKKASGALERNIMPPIEAAESLISGVVSFPISRGAKIIALARGKSEEEAEQIERDIAQRLTFTPKTPGGQKAAEVLGTIVSIPAEIGRELAMMPAESWGLEGAGKEVALTAGELATYAKTGHLSKQGINYLKSRKIKIPEEVERTAVEKPIEPVKPPVEPPQPPEKPSVAHVPEKPIPSIKEAEKVAPEPIMEARGAKEPWEMSREEFTADKKAQDIEAWKQLSNHRARLQGFDKTGRLFVEGYIKRLQDVIGKNPVEENILTAALEKYYAGDTAGAQLLTEKALDRFHQDIIKQAPYDRAERLHESSIKQAISEGKPVPKEVLKDYPDLAEARLPEKSLLEEAKKYKTAEEVVDGVIANSQKAGSANTREYQNAIYGKKGGEAWSVYHSGKVELGMTEKQARQHAIDYLNEAHKGEVAKEAVSANVEKIAKGEKIRDTKTGITYTVNTVVKPKGGNVAWIGAEDRFKNGIKIKPEELGNRYVLSEATAKEAKPPAKAKTPEEEVGNIEKGNKGGFNLGFGPASQFQKMYDALVKGKKSETPLRKDKYAGSINVNKQNIPQPYKEFEAEVSALAPKKTQTWDETGKLSEEILKDYKKSARTLEKAKRGEALNAEEIDAVRQINVNAIDRLKEIVETETPEAVNEQFASYVNDVFKPLSDASSEAGRALNIHKKEVSIRRLANAFSELEKGLNPRQIREFKELNLENPIEVKRFIERLPDPKLKDYLYEFWYNSILSGVPTHIVNVASNTGWALWQLAVHRPFKTIIDAGISTLTGRQRHYYLSETIPAIAGYVKAFKKGASGAWEMTKSGKLVEFETKWEREIGAMTLGSFERSPHRALRAIAPLITPPTKALRAMDVWANTMAYDANIAAQARRASIRQGIKPENRRAFESALIKNPTEEMRLKATDVAKHFTFMDDPGKITSWIIQGRNVIPLGRLVVPFVNTIANLTKRGVEMTPGLGLLLAKGRSPASVIASQIEGSILGLYILQKCDAGEITGSAPENPTEREAFYRQGKQAWAIRLGDTWYQYRRIEPFNTVIASVAIAYDKIKNAKDEETATQIFGNMAEGLAENIIDSSYAQGVTNILDRYGRRKGMVQRQLASLVPYSSFWRSINRAYEASTEGSAKVRDTKSLLGAMSQTLPPGTLDLLGLEKPKARLNVWGEEIELKGGVFRQWLPYKWSEEIDDPVERELERLGVYPGLPKQKVTIRGEEVELPDKLYAEYAMSVGSKMKKALTGLVTQRGYQANKNDLMKVKRIDHMLSSIRRQELNKAKSLYIKSIK